MASIGINIYSFKVYDANGEKVILNNISDGKSIIDILQEFLVNKYNKLTNNSKKEELYKIVDWEIKIQKDQLGNEYQTYLYGRIKSGHYGIETEIVDKDTGKSTHTQTENEAGLKPFDFIIGLLKMSVRKQLLFCKRLAGMV